MRIPFSALLSALTPCLLIPALALAQADVNVEQGLKPYGSYLGGNLDSVSLTNGNLTLHIPLVSYPQRGGRLNLSFFLRYNNKGYHINNSGTSAGWIWDGVGVDVARDQLWGSRSERLKYVIPTDNGNRTIFVTVNSIVSPDGAAHVIGASSGAKGWSSGVLDGSALGYFGIVDLLDGNSPIPTPPSCPQPLPSSWFPVTSQDPNGNKITTNANGWMDTLGRQIPGEPGCPFFDSSTDPKAAQMEMRGIYAGGDTGASPTLEVRMLPGVSTTDLAGCPGNTAAARIWNLPTFANSPSPTSATAPIKLCYANFSIATNFGVANVGEYQRTLQLLQNVILPNGTMWTFNYNNYGDLTYLGLPTGGSISYGWNTFQFCGGRSRTITSRTANDGSSSRTWTYNWTPSPGYGTPTTLLLTDPDGNDSVHVSTSQGGCSFYETEARYYQGSSSSSSNLLKTVDTTYTPASTDPSDYYVGQSTVVDIFPAVTTTTWANGQTSTVKRTYDTPVPATAYLFNCFNCDTNPQTVSYNKMNGQVTSESLFDYGNSTTPIRTTSTQYFTLDDLSTVIITDGNGNKCAETDYTYDDPNRLISSGITTQHGTPYFGAVRANPSSAKKWLSTAPCTPTANWSQITSYSNYNDTGTLAASIDPLNNTTSYNYSPTFYGAYVTQTVLPNTGVQHTVSASYDFNTGLQTSFTNQNNNTSNYTWDNMSRVSTATYPDGGQTTFNYTDTVGSLTVERLNKITSTTSLDYLVSFDGSGRPTQTKLASDPDGVTYTPTTYDALGRVYQAYNPTRCSTPTTNCGESTWGYTTYAYDALGRITQLTLQDGQIVSTNYSGNCTTVNDEAGKARKSCSDALGRLTQVFEDPTGLNYETDYFYDALDNLTRVDQWGGPHSNSGDRVRTFSYDGVSRLISATNPESGTATYTYDANGNLTSKTSPAPNQTGSATVTVSYCYDALNRLTSRAYSPQSCPMSSPVASYIYDQSACLGASSCFNIGRRTGMTDQAGSEAWSYDQMGRVLEDQRTTNGVTSTFPYTYNLDGSVASMNYGSQHMIFTPGGAGRPVSEFDTGGTGPANSANYAPNGSLCGLYNSFDVNMSYSYTFNSRFQPVTIQAANNSGSPRTILTPCAVNPIYSTQTTQTNLDLKYTYTDSSGHNNGNVVSIANNLDWDRGQSFTYDSLNRLATAQTVGTNQPDFPGDTTYLQECWAEQYSYDPWGNLLSILPSSSSSYTGCSQESGFNFSGAMGANNQITASGYVYDAAGNLIAVPPSGTTYTYDAGNQLVSAGGQAYIYDGDGKRVAKAPASTPTQPTHIYWYGNGNNILQETDGTGNLLYNNYYFNGMLLTRWNTTNSGWPMNHYAYDAIGNMRFEWYHAWGVSDYYPFGAEIALQSPDPSNQFKFAGKERDSESGNDNFRARFYSSSLGRFMSPDPYNSMMIRQGMKAGGLREDAAGNFLKGFLEDPQNWNKYTYGLNNPLRFVDPTGAAPQDGHHLISERTTFDVIGKAFTDAIKTGPLSGNGFPNQPGFNVMHRLYNAEVNKMLNEAMEKAGPTERWSIQQWKDFANSVLNSEEPAIKEFLDELEENNPGAKAALASSIAGYRVSTTVIARFIVSSLARNLFRILILCVDCDKPREVVTSRFVTPKS